MLTIDTKIGAWPARMDTGTAARYLREQHGLPTEPKTLVNRRALRKGPAVQYFGAKPLYDRAELDRWAREEALQPVSPLTRNVRRRMDWWTARAKADTDAVDDTGPPAATPLPEPSRPPETMPELQNHS